MNSTNENNNSSDNDDWDDWDDEAGGDTGNPVVLGEGPAASAYQKIIDLLVDELAPPIDMDGCSARLLDAVESALKEADI